MLSMTGFGKAAIDSDGLIVTVEMKSVNSRYLDISCKLPKIFSEFEDLVRKTVSACVSRGKIDIYISYRDMRGTVNNYRLDINAAKAYYDAEKELKANFPDLESSLNTVALLKMPDVLINEAKTEDNDFAVIIKKAVSAACENFNKMRGQEGKKIKADLLEKNTAIAGYVKNIAKRAPNVSAEYKIKIEKRVKEILGAVPIDENKLINEVAFFSEKCAIDEELTRLKSHISQFEKLCNSENSGKKLDFLIQEFFREANTICSKSNDIEITKIGLDLKSEIEKIREQIQNIE